MTYLIDCPVCGHNVEVSPNIGDLNQCQQAGCLAQFWFDLHEGVIMG